VVRRCSREGKLVGKDRACWHSSSDVLISDHLFSQLDYGSILGRRKEATMKLKFRMTFTGKPIGETMRHRGRTGG
jgi:hypothetical protein